MSLAKRVEDESMTPTLGNGQRILTHPFTSGSAGRFDLVVLHAPDQDETIVKRVIGVPGDAIQIQGTGAASTQVEIGPHDRGPWLRVANRAWRGQWEQPTPCCSVAGTRTAAPRTVVIPAGRYFVLGDDPDVSVDSRMFGWVDASSIVARVWLRVWPVSRVGTVGSNVRLVAVAATSS